MARITVEDCLEKIDSQYDLVLLAKERTTQLNAGLKPLVEQDNDKNTVISLREIGDGKISLKNLEDSAINKLRKQPEETAEIEDLEEEKEDNFDKIYKGEISKSGTAILPSKRTRRMPDKANIDFKKAAKEIEEKNKEEEEAKPEVEVKDESISAEKKQE